MAGPPLAPPPAPAAPVVVPIITEQVLLDKARDVIQALPGPIRGVVAGNVNDLVRYVEPELNALNGYLNGMSNLARYKLGNRPAGFTRLRTAGKDNNYCLIDRTLTQEKRLKLLGTLAGQLMPFASMYHTTAAHAAITPVEVNQFHNAHANTYAFHAVRTIARNFRDNFVAACQRIVDDWDDIEQLFFRNRNFPGDIGMPNMVLLKLDEIIVADSDPHKKGKRVMILKFLANPEGGPNVPPPQGRMAAFMARFGVGTGAANANRLNFNRPQIVRLVYKPSDLEVDCRLVGNTVELRNQLAHLVGNPDPVTGLPDLTAGGGSLFEVFNNHIGNTVNPPLRLPVYRILPRSVGSRLGPLQNPMPTGNGYGYIEFLTHNPEPQDANGTTTGEDRGALPSEKWDWIATSDAEIRSFYRQMGWIGMIAEVFGMADVHKENMIVHRKQPHLIDLEISFKTRIESFETTLITMIYSEGRPPDQKCHLYYRGRIGGTKWTTGSHAANCMADGMTEAANAMIQPAAINAINTWLADAHLGNTFVRYTAAETGYYWQQFLASYYQNPLAQPPDPNNPADAAWGQNHFPVNYRTGLTSWCASRDGDGFVKHQPNFALRDPHHDWKCYMYCDLPAFYRRLNSVELLNARGEYCVINQPAQLPPPNPPIPALRDIAGPHYYDYYPAEHLFNIDPTNPVLGRNDVQPNPSAALRLQFTGAGHALTGAARGVEQSDNWWRIADGANTCHILAEHGEWRVYRPADAIVMTQRQFARFHQDAAHRNALLTEAQGTIRGVCQAVRGHSYNGF